MTGRQRRGTPVRAALPSVRRSRGTSIRPPRLSAARSLSGAGVAVALLLVLSACTLIAGGPSQPQVTGVVLSLDSPALGQVDGFELLTEAGTILTFDTTELEFDPDFPASHVAEHQVLGDPVRVTYRADGDRLVVTHLEDAG